jgi:hypothetical protein
MTLQMFLAGFYLTIQLLRISGKQKAWRKKRKYASILFSLLLQLLPLQLFQDHRDGNLEASGMTMARSLHQAIPSGFQVTEPVGNI